jgi:hypothetical protein
MNKNELITVCDDFDKINTEFNKFFAELNEVIVPDVQTEKVIQSISNIDCKHINKDWKDFNIMNEKFINICDDVNLIIAPCKYRNFNLKPGMMLFDDKRGFIVNQNKRIPFVANYEDRSYIYDRDNMDRHKSIIRLHGYMLGENGISGIGYIDISEDDYSKKEFNTIQNAVDLALGDNKLKRLFLEPPENRYNDDTRFIVYSLQSDFVCMFAHVIGDVYLQLFNNGMRNKLVTLSKEQVNAFHEITSYGLINYGNSPLRLADSHSFNDLLKSYFFGQDSESYKQEDVNNFLSNLRDYYSQHSSDMKSINVDGIVSFACTNTTMPDGFHVRPFTVILKPDKAKSYLYLTNEGLYFDSELIDDNLHNVYLTSLHSGGPIDSSDSMIFNGYYFNGKIFKHGYFSIKNGLSKDIIKSIYYSLVESSFFKSYVAFEEDFDNTWYIINERLADAYDDDKLDDAIVRLLENIYDEYLLHKKYMLKLPIEYEELTDAEFYSKSGVNTDDVNFDNIIQ